MIKSFLIQIIFPIFLFSSQQIILVVGDDFNSSAASLECFEDSSLIYSTRVNLGTNGLGWGLGEKKLQQKESDPLKHEGDKRAPAGIFKLETLFGYEKDANYKLPYLHTSDDLICVDDSQSPFYNKIITKKGDEKSFEYMKRKDNQYKYGVTVAHNRDAIALRGSCIFLHIEKERNHTTAGCTSMKEKDLKFIINWLDEKKNPILIQIPKTSSKEILQLYPMLKASKLLE